MIGSANLPAGTKQLRLYTIAAGVYTQVEAETATNAGGDLAVIWSAAFTGTYAARLGVALFNDSQLAAFDHVRLVDSDATFLAEGLKANTIMDTELRYTASDDGETKDVTIGPAT